MDQAGARRNHGRDEISRLPRSAVSFNGLALSREPHKKFSTSCPEGVRGSWLVGCSALIGSSEPEQRTQRSERSLHLRDQQAFPLWRRKHEG